jgi:hypothetical protein
MRIIIHVDDQDARGAPAPISGQELSAPDMTPTGSVPVNAGAAQAGPAVELAARAARLGALSAGPAPSAPPDAAGVPGFTPAGLGPGSGPRPSDGADTPSGRSTDVSAGPAPTID